MRKKHLLGWANYLTYGRIGTIPLFVIVMAYLPPAPQLLSKTQWVLSWFIFIFYVLSGFTDVIDGYLARRRESTGSFGKFIDPLADKLVSTAVLVMLIPLNRLSAWIVVVLIAREMTITALRGMAISEDLEIAASQWGKRKTLLQNFALGALLIYYPVWGFNFSAAGDWLIYGAMIISLGSGIHYITQFFREVLVRQQNNVPD